MSHSPLTPSPLSAEARYASVSQQSEPIDSQNARTFQSRHENKKCDFSNVSSISWTDTEYRGGSTAFQHDGTQGYQSTNSSPAAKIRRSRFDFEVLIADFLAIGIPLGLLIFTTLIWLKDQTEAPTEQIGEWINAASILSTLFPVFFAAVVGRLMAQAARWKLESGSTLKSLEQLLGSKTVGGALLTPYHLRTLNALGLTLLVLWAFSPLGAQALLRIAELRLQPHATPSSTTYFDTRGRSLFADWALEGGSAQLTGWVRTDQIASIYNGLLLAPSTIKNDTMDLFGNVKVPMLSSLKSRPGGGGWRDVPGGDVPYSGLVGVPMLDVSTGNTTFQMESNYLELACQKPKLMDQDEKFIRLNSSALSSYYQFGNSTPPNGTFQGRPVINATGEDFSYSATQFSPWSLASNRFIDGSWTNGDWVNKRGNKFAGEAPWNWVTLLSDSLLLFENEKDIASGPASLYFSTIVRSQVLGGVRYPFETYCNASQSYVESKVTCEKSDSDTRKVCRVDSMRPSQKDNPTGDITLLSFPRIFDMVSRNMPFTTGENVVEASNSDLTLQYLADPSLANISDGLSVQLSTLEKEDFSLRLTQLMNSYLHLSQMYTSVLGTLNTPDGTSALSYNLTAESQVTNLLTTYHVPRVWAILCVASCMVMLAGGTASVLFAHLAVGPEVFGFASTAVRDNKYMILPEEISVMEGPEIASSLDQMRVKFGLMRGALGDKVGIGLEESVTNIRETLGSKT